MTAADSQTGLVLFLMLVLFTVNYPAGIKLLTQAAANYLKS